MNKHFLTDDMVQYACIYISGNTKTQDWIEKQPDAQRFAIWIDEYTD